MRYVYSDDSTRCIQIDRVGLRAFLVEQGMTREQLQTLIIRFGVRRKVNDCLVNGKKLLPQTLGGLHSGNTITVYTHGKPECAWLNYVLLHELRHHMQVQWTSEHAYHFVIDGKIINYDETISYQEQPWEIDANRFARHHRDKRFLSLTGEVQAIEQILPVLGQRQKTTLTGPMKWIAVGLGAIASVVLIALPSRDSKNSLLGEGEER